MSPRCIWGHRWSPRHNGQWGNHERCDRCGRIRALMPRRRYRH